jgi:hypothetical protein
VTYCLSWPADFVDVKFILYRSRTFAMFVVAGLLSVFHT